MEFFSIEVVIVHIIQHTYGVVPTFREMQGDPTSKMEVGVKPNKKWAWIRGETLCNNVQTKVLQIYNAKDGLVHIKTA